MQSIAVLCRLFLMIVVPPDLPDVLHVTEGDNVRIRGHRVGLIHIVEAYDGGYTAESIATFFPTVSLSTIHKIIAYYLDHQNDVRAYVNKVNHEFNEFMKNNPSKAPSLAQLRERLARRNKTLQSPPSVA